MEAGPLAQHVLSTQSMEAIFEIMVNIPLAVFPLPGTYRGLKSSGGSERIKITKWLSDNIM